MANVMAAIANNGTVYRPQFVKRVETTDGQSVVEEQPAVTNDLGFKKTTLLQIRQALSDVVNSNRGTGSKARVHGIEVGGKTGTSQVGSLGAERSKQGHMARERKDHAWFIAFAPVSAPEIAVAVLAEHAGEHGGTAAAPIAQQVIAHYFGVADDDDATIRQTARLSF
jgi:penicillin-binding protein 2